MRGLIFPGNAMHRLSLRRVCLTLTACNTTAIVFGQDSGWICQRIAPSLYGQWGAPLGFLPSNSWEVVAVLALFALFCVSVLVCFQVLAMAPRQHGRRLPAAARGRVWLSVANVIAMVFILVGPQLTR